MKEFLHLFFNGNGNSEKPLYRPIAFGLTFLLFDFLIMGVVSSFFFGNLLIMLLFGFGILLLNYGLLSYFGIVEGMLMIPFLILVNCLAVLEYQDDWYRKWNASSAVVLASELENHRIAHEFVGIDFDTDYDGGTSVSYYAVPVLKKNNSDYVYAWYVGEEFEKQKPYWSSSVFEKTKNACISGILIPESSFKYELYQSAIQNSLGKNNIQMNKNSLMLIPDPNPEIFLLKRQEEMNRVFLFYIPLSWISLVVLIRMIRVVIQNSRSFTQE